MGNVNTAVTGVDNNVTGLSTTLGGKVDQLKQLIGDAAGADLTALLDLLKQEIDTISGNTSGLGTAVGNVNTTVNTINTNTSGLGTAVAAQISNLEGKIDDIQTAVDDITVDIDLHVEEGVIAAIKAEILAAKASINSNIAGVRQFIHDTHLVDPFDVAVTICTEIEGGAAIEGMANLGIGVGLQAHLGVDFYGVGAQIGIEPKGEIGAGLNIRSDVETNVTACINGIFTRQTSDPLEEAAIIALGRNATEIALLTELVETGNRYSTRIAASTNSIKLVEGTLNTGSDRLNNSLTAYEAFSTLNLQKIAKIIVNTGNSSTPNTALDDFAASMPSFGVGNLLGDPTTNSASTNGFGGLVNLVSNDITNIGTTITNGLSTLGLGSVGGLSGLGNVTSLVQLDGIATAFEGIPGVIANIDGIAAQVDAEVQKIIAGVCKLITQVIPGECFLLF